MRMLRVALVLFVLASFVAATAAVSMAATVTPTAPKVTMKPTIKPVASMMPTKKPGKMIDLTQMKANVDAIYKKLKTNTKMPATNNTTAKAAKTATATPVAKATAMPKPSMKLSTPDMRAMSPMSVSGVGLLPQLGSTKATLGAAPGNNLVISVG